MEIQNISGPDAIPRGTVENRAVKTETEPVEKNRETREQPREESKGLNIDTLA